MLTIGQKIKINPYFDEWFEAEVIYLNDINNECICLYTDLEFVKQNFSFINDGKKDKQVRV